ncbi:unnamed protein product [Dibothriocephalus latus]|uniref:Uncharacterized protein n=1 Tax=Dibothriocephalus latus TaxID=60516 RepID=A0A3P7LPT9_DIBLA|nr:unnamed protein product [Dibothriocephalus latus]
MARKNQEAVTDYINEVIKTNRTPLICRVAPRVAPRKRKKTSIEEAIHRNKAHPPPKTFSNKFLHRVNSTRDPKELVANGTLKNEEIVRSNCLVHIEQNPVTHKFVGIKTPPSSACPKVTLTTPLTPQPQPRGGTKGVGASVNVVIRQGTPSRSDKMSRMANTASSPTDLRTGKFVGKSTQSPTDWPTSMDVSSIQNPPVPVVTKSPTYLTPSSKRYVEHPGLAARPLSLRRYVVYYGGGDRRTYAAVSHEPPPALRNFATSVVLFSDVISSDWLTERIVPVWEDACPVPLTQTNNSVIRLLFADVFPISVYALVIVGENGALQCFDTVPMWEGSLGVIPTFETDLRLLLVEYQVAERALNLATRIPFFSPLQSWKKHRLFIRNINIPPKYMLLPTLPKQSIIWKTSSPAKLVQKEQIILSASRCLLDTGYSKCFATKHFNVSLKSAKVTHKRDSGLDFIEEGLSIRLEYPIFHDVKANLHHVTRRVALTLETCKVHMTRSEHLECTIVKTVVRMVEPEVLEAEALKIPETQKLHRMAPTHLTRTSSPDGDRSMSARFIRSARRQDTFWQCIFLNACICAGLATGKICFFQICSGDLASLFGVVSAYLTVVSFVSFHFPKRRGNF